jgi:biopolymer transport protein ExbD
LLVIAILALRVKASRPSLPALLLGVVALSGAIGVRFLARGKIDGAFEQISIAGLITLAGVSAMTVRALPRGDALVLASAAILAMASLVLVEHDLVQYQALAAYASGEGVEDLAHGALEAGSFRKILAADALAAAIAVLPVIVSSVPSTTPPRVGRAALALVLAGVSAILGRAAVTRDLRALTRESLTHVELPRGSGSPPRRAAVVEVDAHGKTDLFLPGEAGKILTDENVEEVKRAGYAVFAVAADKRVTFQTLSDALSPLRRSGVNEIDLLLAAPPVEANLGDWTPLATEDLRALRVHMDDAFGVLGPRTLAVIDGPSVRARRADGEVFTVKDPVGEKIPVVLAPADGDTVDRIVSALAQFAGGSTMILSRDRVGITKLVDAPPPPPPAPPQPAQPKVREGVVEVTGDLPREVVMRIVRQHFGRIRWCYGEALKRDGSMNGKVVLRFTIDREGNATKVTEGASTLKDEALFTCLKAPFEKLTFPKPEGGPVVVTYPIFLTPPE